MLLDVVSRAVGRYSRLRFTAEHAVDGHPKRIAHHVPQRQIGAADRMHHSAGAAVVHGRPPKDVPVPFEVERIFAQQEFGEVLLDNRAAPRTAAPISFDPLVGGDLHGETADRRVVGHE